MYMPPGSRAWDESHSRFLLAQAQRFTRFGNGAKKTFANKVTNPGAMAAEKTKEETEARRSHLNIFLSSLHQVFSSTKISSSSNTYSHPVAHSLSAGLETPTPDWQCLPEGEGVTVSEAKAAANLSLEMMRTV